MNNNLPRILIALWRMPYPANDGTRYKILNNIVKPLVGVYNIEFLIVSIESVTSEQVDYIEKNFGKVHLFKRSKISFLFNFLKGFLIGLPMQVTGYYLKSAQNWLSQNIQNYHAVYVHEIRMAQYFKNIADKAKVIFDFNDAISLNYKEAKKHTLLPMNLFYFFEGLQVKAYEKRVLGMFENYNVVSDFDRQYLLKMLPLGKQEGVNFVSIPHGVSVSSENILLNSANNIFFLGNLEYAPNRDSIKYFLKNIWPGVYEMCPQTKFFIIGKGKSLKGFESMVNVYFTGFVPNVLEFIEQNSCGIMVAPIRFGAGTPSKIIEAMAMGLPVITTPIGCHGIAGVINGHDIVMIDSKNTNEWVDSIIHLLNNTQEQKSIGQNAKKFILENNEIGIVQKKWLDLFTKVVNK